MPPRRAHPIDPAQHMSVGRNHSQHSESSGSPQATENQSGHPLASSSQPARNDLPQMRDEPHVEQPLLAGARNPGMRLEDAEDDYSDNVSDPTQDCVWHYQSNTQPLAIRHEDQTALEGSGPKRRKRRRAERESEHSKRLAKVSGGAGSDFGPLGCIRESASGRLEYQDGEAWIPAVYHCTIRDQLIRKAKTCDTDVYRYPRECGQHPHDTTAFLESQRDWCLERDLGWVVTDDVLYMFDQPEKSTPTFPVQWMFHEGRVVIDLNNHPVKDYPDLPLTLSSEVEGALIEAILRIDTRITIIDILARVPGDRVNGAIFTPANITNRTYRFRLENCVKSWNIRKSSKVLNDFIWARMSVAARKANSTRELRKLTKEEQKEAKKPNAGKHSANAGGYALPREGKDETKERALTTLNFPVEGATKPAPSSSKKRKRPAPTSNYNGNEESQPLSFALEQGRSTHTDTSRRPHEPIPSAAYAPQNSYSGQWHGEMSFQFDNHIPNRVPSLSTPNTQDLFRTFGSSATPTNLANSVSAQEFPIMNGPFESQGGPSTNFNVGNPYQGYQRQMMPVDYVEERVFSSSRYTVNPFAGGTSFTAIPPPLEIDYRSIPPRSDVDMQSIQDALEITRRECELWMRFDGGPTTRYQHYMFQLQELQDSFAARWVSFGSLPPGQLLQNFWKLPWRNGFNDWRVLRPPPDPDGRFGYEGPYYYF